MAIVLLCAGVLSSCSLLPSHPPIGGGDGTKRQTDAVMQQIAGAVKGHDISALKKLFSPIARRKATDLDSGLTSFLSVFPSGQMTWKSDGIGSASQHDGTDIVELSANYVVSTNGKKYDLFFPYFTINTKDPDNVGIYALGIAPHTTDTLTPSGTLKPFYKWAGQFSFESYSSATPSVYVEQN